MEASLILATAPQKFGCGWWRNHPLKPLASITCGGRMDARHAGAAAVKRRRDSAMGAQSAVAD